MRVNLAPFLIFPTFYMLFSNQQIFVKICIVFFKEIGYNKSNSYVSSQIENPT